MRTSRGSRPRITRPIGACESFRNNRKSTTDPAITTVPFGRSLRAGPPIAEYRYHRAFPAYSNLRSNALLGVDGALGHFTEVLSGDYYQSFATSSPHQIWSAAMVISPILRGMFGLETDVEKHQIMLAPHIPADWTNFAIHNVRLGGVSVDFKYHKTAESMVLETKRTGTGDCWVEFSPAFSLRTVVISVEMNGRPLAFKMLPNQNDQHLAVRFQLNSGTNSLVIRTRNDFGLSLANELPPLGSASRGLRVLSESWNASKNQLTLEVSGLAGATLRTFRRGIRLKCLRWTEERFPRPESWRFRCRRGRPIRTYRRR